MRSRFSKSLAAFTLIELMVVVAIIGILAAVAIPKFADLLTKSKEAGIKSNLGALRSALSIYYSDNESRYPDALDSLNRSKYLSSIPTFTVPWVLSIGNPGHGAAPPDGPTVSYACAPLCGSSVLGNLSRDPGSGFVRWGYITPGDSEPLSGMIFVGCWHRDTKGFLWTSY